MNFETQLRLWYNQNKRTLPWRDSGNAYFVWLSEVIMQQTRVSQGTAYFNRFAEHFPTVQHLANAPADEVMKLWEGLGYYSRARNLHAGAKQIVADFSGQMPENYADLLKIKGIGPYSAAAISSICFNQKKAVVDGNVFRVLGRIHGIETPINTTAGIKTFTSLAEKLISTSDYPGEYNQAIMEFGALHCTPKNPKCSSCIFNNKCVAIATGKIAVLPVKIKSNPLKNRHLNYLVAIEGEKIAIEKRTTKDIWAGLYQFPLEESDVNITALKNAALMAPTIKHILSHQRLFISFWMIRPEKLALADKYEWVAMNDLSRYPFPIAIKRFIETNLLHLRNRLS